MMLKDLKKEMPYKFRVQQAKEYGANCVAYIDSRDVQDLLDDVIGPDKWQDKYYEVKGNLFCSIGILCGKTWVWKTDCGTESNVDKQKGEASDAFKRAAVKWGIGRFLYSLGMPRLKTKKHTNGKFYPADNNGNILWDADSLTVFCKGLINSTVPKPPKKAPPKKSTAMNEHEIAAMKNVWAMTKSLMPVDSNEDVFKRMVMSHLYKVVGHWPTTQQEQEEAINILDKEFNKR